MWYVNEAAAERIAIGAGILGTGGGGTPYVGKVYLRRLLREGQGTAPPVVGAPGAVPDGGMGAPMVGIERLTGGDGAWRRLCGARTAQRVVSGAPAKNAAIAARNGSVGETNSPSGATCVTWR